MEQNTFNNFKILHLIGEGSFGKVFKAAEIDTKNVVALKILLKVSELIGNQIISELFTSDHSLF